MIRAVQWEEAVLVSQEILTISVIVLAAFATGGVAYVMIYPFLSGERKAQKRVQTVTRGSATRTARAIGQDPGQNRRKQVQDSLKELEAKQKSKKKLTMRSRLLCAGLSIEPRTFYICSVVFGFVVAIGLLVARLPVYAAGPAGLVAMLGIPRWLLSFLARRREKKFLQEFANSLDIIVRGVKTGLPLNDCLQIIASEAPEPVKSEFAELVEQQRVGVTLAKGLERMYEHMPLPEVNFFMIVIAIQQQAGGNLAEALGNLSQVLRERKKLKSKVEAFSSEAKSSASIIGALPIVVMGLVYISTPDYIALLWTEKLGHMMLMGSAFWMLCGVLVMRKMINFDY